eukprot:scaffold16728_cov60-Attheya_sp.AAC.3
MCELDRSDSPKAVTMKYWRSRSADARSCTIFQVAPALKYANHIKQSSCDKTLPEKVETCVYYVYHPQSV